MATKYIFSNNASTTLAESVSATATVLNLASGKGDLFPSPTTDEAFPITLVDAATGLTNEICYCTSRSGDALTVTRGEEGTTALAWSAGDTAANYITAGTINAWLQASDLDSYATETWVEDQDYATETWVNGTYVSGGTGYEIKPNGKIEQWGTYTTGSTGLVTIYFPTPFPNSCDNIGVNEANATGTWTVNTPTLHGVNQAPNNSAFIANVRIWDASNKVWTAGNATGYWRAIGH